MFKVEQCLTDCLSSIFHGLACMKKRQCRPLSTVTYKFTTYNLDMTSQKPPNSLFMRPQRESCRQS